MQQLLNHISPSSFRHQDWGIYSSHDGHALPQWSEATMLLKPSFWKTKEGGSALVLLVGFQQASVWPLMEQDAGQDELLA